MPVPYIIALILAVVVVVAARFVVPGLPWRARAASMTKADVALAAVGLLGLVVHCSAMFGRSWFQTIPGTGFVSSQINEGGLASMLWFAIPAALLVIGLRRQHWIVLAVLSLALLSVGVTMYVRVPTSTHLIAIFVTTVIVAAVISLLVVRRQPRVSGS
ncbi:MAG: hypothetical protein Q8M65_12105 [Rhodoglobus sp.]|nr:hypothetical protein [Rhodoglobus sp.]